MLKLDYFSKRGDILPLTNNPYFYLTNIDGQTSFSSSVSSSTIGNSDGDDVTNIRANPRTIIIDLEIKAGINVEEAKREILRVVKPKQTGRLVWTQDNRELTISGIVENFEMPRWQSGVIGQISIHCEQPFWEDVETVIQTISEAINHHYFTDNLADMLFFPETGIVLGEYDTIRTKTFTNDGDVAVGVEITIMAVDTVTNPIIYAENGDFFGVGYGTGENKLVLEQGDSVVITTTRGHKTVTMNGANLLDKVKPNSTWLQLETGRNTFSINSDDETITNMYFDISYKQRYV